MKKFFQEFKQFISRGNVLDLAVGVIIGGAFTAIVNALTTNILKPLINWVLYLILGSDGSLEGVYTFLVGDSTDLEAAIFIDWGAFISAIINFVLIAFVLFIIIKSINTLKAENDKFADKIKKSTISKEDRKELKKQGIKLTDKQAVAKYFEDKKLKEEEEAKAKAEADRKFKEENPTELELLKDIRELLKNKNN